MAFDLQSKIWKKSIDPSIAQEKKFDVTNKHLEIKGLRMFFISNPGVCHSLPTGNNCLFLCGKNSRRANTASTSTAITGSRREVK
jgi:hypothetical protein